jgi:death-on-curing protein
MQPDPFFLTLDEVLEIHDAQITAFGGTLGIRSREALESAVATPRAGFGGEFLHPTLWHMAAAYAFHIAENQPFLDGNKRTAIVAAITFLDLNGFLVVDPDERLYDAMMAIAARGLDKDGLAELLRELCGVQDDG